MEAIWIYRPIFREVVYALPLNVQGERKPIEVLRNKSQLQGPASRQNRFMTFTSNEPGASSLRHPIRSERDLTTDTSSDLRSRWHGHGVLATRRQGTLLPGS